MKTIRKKIIEHLMETPSTCEEISQLLRIKEKEVYDHLFHIDKTVKANGKRLKVIPYYCVKCGYIFKNRKQFSKPGRCPVCKNQRIGEAVFEIT
jgi:hypothetical protein